MVFSVELNELEGSTGPISLLFGKMIKLVETVLSFGFFNHVGTDKCEASESLLPRRNRLVK